MKSAILLLIFGAHGFKQELEQKSAEHESNASMWDFQKQDEIGQLNKWLNDHEKRENKMKNKEKK